jgi:integral membrane protein
MTAPSPNSHRIALTAYRIFAWVTGVGLVLLCAAMVNEYLLGGSHRPVALVGMLHGFLYMGYVVCTLVLAERCRWRPVRAVVVALAGTIPLASFVAERKVTKLVRDQSALASRY